jgi:hypothetical protein
MRVGVTVLARFGRCGPRGRGSRTSTHHQLHLLPLSCQTVMTPVCVLTCCPLRHRIAITDISKRTRTDWSRRTCKMGRQLRGFSSAIERTRRRVWRRCHATDGAMGGLRARRRRGDLRAGRCVRADGGCHRCGGMITRGGTRCKRSLETARWAWRASAEGDARGGPCECGENVGLDLLSPW